MRYFLKTSFSLLIFLTSFTNFSQDTRLFEQTWYLQDLILNGESNVPPINDELQFISMDMTKPDIFHTVVCAGTDGGGTLSFSGLTEFSFPTGLVFLTGGCIEIENVIYTNLYNDDFWDTSSLDPFQYEIIEIGASRMLTITASNGNQALYGDNILSINDYKKTLVQIYPVPASNQLFLQVSQSTRINKVRVFDVQGRLINQQEPSQTSLIEIDTTILHSGLYFVQVLDMNGRVSVERFVKE